MIERLAERTWLEHSLELAGRWAAVPEAPMRSHQLAAHLSEVGPAEAVWIAEGILRGALQKDEACALLAHSFIDPDEVLARIPSEKVDHMLDAGMRDQCVAAVQWLRTASLVDDASADVDPEHLVDRELRGLTLGERRALARRAQGDRLDRLLADPDPVVVQNLLNNPRTTEATVVRLCARRPTVSAALEMVLRAPRWRRRYRVRLALIQNPYLRVRFALNLLVLLDGRDLQAAWRDESLSPALRLGAQRLLDLLQTLTGERFLTM